MDASKPSLFVVDSAFHPGSVMIASRVSTTEWYSSVNAVRAVCLATQRVQQRSTSFILWSLPLMPGKRSMWSSELCCRFGEFGKNMLISFKMSHMFRTITTVDVDMTHKVSTCEEQWTCTAFEYFSSILAATPLALPAPS